MTYQKVEGGHHSVKSQNKATGNYKPIILYERNFPVLTAMFDYVANLNGCRVKIEDNKISTKGNLTDVILSIEATYDFIKDYSRRLQ